MTVFLAAIALGDSALPPGLLARMGTSVAAAGEVQSAAHGRVALAWCDLGLWPGPSVADTADTLTVIAGDPLVCQADRAMSRQDSMGAIAARGADPAVLASAEGSYCGIVWNRNASTLVAFTDKLGVRPVYVARSASVLYVSSVQWALRALPDVPKEPDWRAATEVAAMGYPLDDRTLFADIKVLRAGEQFIADARGSKVQLYWDWSGIPTNQLRGEALQQCVLRSFNTAVDDRLQGQSRAMAFLSGGMDSRLIVSRLRERGVLVYTLNFAPEGSQDGVLGRMAAEAMGTHHFEFRGEAESFTERQARAVTAWREAHPAVSCWPENPGLVWSGDGGSVTLGHVYLDSGTLRTARTQGVRAAAAAIQRENRLFVSRHMFRKSYRHLADVLLQGIVDDLQSRDDVEPGRNCLYFYMLNNQRRHLAEYYETVHVTRMDLVLPFFDGRFLAAVLGSPIEPFLLHALYNDLMQLLPGNAGQVPWQAYPGHLPCPWPVPGGFRDQWVAGWYPPAAQRRKKRRRYRAALRQILSPSFPRHVLSRPALFAAVLASYVGIDRSYLLGAMKPFLEAWAPSWGAHTPLSPTVELPDNDVIKPAQ